ncbi:MAG: hypothetical protein IJ770_05050 [Alphaproteobacteria bacterium]|nr:hypothetical protein [Alphaproteobacteria bacterium]
MKKVLIILLCILAALLFVGCSWFDSTPVEPEILGVEHIVQDRGLMYVEIDSTRYPVKRIFTGETHPRVGSDVKIPPVDGMLVTVVNMTGKNSDYQGIQFMLGEWNEAQIEQAFRRNYTLAVVALGVILLCVIGLIVSSFIADEQQRKKYGGYYNISSVHKD